MMDSLQICFQSHVLRFREEGDSYYTMTPYGKVVKLNYTAYKMLSLCCDTTDGATLCDKVVKTFGITEEEAYKETESFINNMFKCGLLERTNG